MNVLLWACLVWTGSPADVSGGQDTALHSEPVYYEDAPNGMTRFFYDDQYYLADKHCQFKAIERVGYYDFRKRMFIDEFTDFNNQGRAVLRGSYRDGKKDGQFRAYHSNGQLKWEVTFQHDLPQGMWKYYYPDGKPLLEVEFGAGGVFIHNFWDQRGRHRVVNGKGRYEFEVTADGYNPFGYIRYNRKGRVVEGRPHGAWAIEYVFDGGRKEDAGYEFYQHGKFVSGYDAYPNELFHDAPRYALVPVDFFNRAVEMNGKPCTIDAYSGFTAYLGKHLEDWFGELEEMPLPSKIEFTVNVSKHGVPGNVKMKSTFADKRYANALLEGLKWVDFWFPSYAEGAYIDDTLTVTMEAFPNIPERKLRFFDIHIRREKGI